MPAKPRINGTRQTAEFILEQLSSGWTTGDLIAPHGTLRFCAAVFAAGAKLAEFAKARRGTPG